MKKTLGLALAFLLAASAVHATPPKKKNCPKTLAVCVDGGCGGDQALGKLKNRMDDAEQPEEWTLSRIIKLNAKVPKTWKMGEDRTTLAEVGEGTAVVVTAFLLHAAREKGESCNCFLTGEGDVDWHLNLVSKKPASPLTKPTKKAAMKKSVVVEITPRVRAERNGWDWNNVHELEKAHAYVRVTGFLLLDTMHKKVDKLSRATAWEVHPVTAFEVCTESKAKCDEGEGWERLEEHA